MHFLIVTSARCGSKWLATVLDRSSTHTVRHEAVDPSSVYGPWYTRPFPIGRWLQSPKPYGECHGKLRRYCVPGRPGPEQAIPLRFVLLRDRRDVVASWMNRGQHTLDDLSWITHQVCLIERYQLDLCRQNGFGRLDLERLSTDRSALQRLVAEVRSDLVVTDDDLRPVNASRTGWFSWTPDAQRTYDHVADRFADPGPPVPPAI